MKIEQILAKMQLQAAEESRQQRQRQREESAYPTVTAGMLEDQKLNQIRYLRKETAEAKFQLELDRQLQAETKKNLAATMKLRESRLTPEERIASG